PGNALGTAPRAHCGHEEAVTIPMHTGKTKLSPISGGDWGPQPPGAQFTPVHVPQSPTQDRRRLHPPAASLGLRSLAPYTRVDPPARRPCQCLRLGPELAACGPPENRTAWSPPLGLPLQSCLGLCLGRRVLPWTRKEINREARDNGPFVAVSLTGGREAPDQALGTAEDPGGHKQTDTELGP
ncbi:Hypothetical predicted protein, partial [Lynx pardinus]